MRTASTLYPELLPAEVTEIIDPIGQIGSIPEHARALCARSVAPAAAFGPQAEHHTFEAVAHAVADTVFATEWEPLLAPTLADADSFTAELRRALATDFTAMAIRPLADAMPEDADDPERAYVSFCQDLLSDGLARFAAGHPALAQRVVLRMTNRVRAVAEMLRRLAADRVDIAAAYGIGTTSRIAAAEFSGDLHNHGRSVSVLVFEDGTHLVYKPRPVDCESAYADFCARATAIVDRPLGAARALRRDGYGYVEFLTADPSHDDLGAVGTLAAVMYALNARDMHFTNILPTARGPVPIDLETLLHPRRHRQTAVPESIDNGYRRLETSVYGTGVLPLVMTSRHRQGSVDVGYVGGGEIRGGGPFRGFQVEHPFSTRLRVSWRPDAAVTPAAPVAPDHAATDRVRSDCERFIDGFTHTYQRLMARRAEFAALVSDAFGDCELRYLHNATVVYEQCLRLVTSTEPSTAPDLTAGLLKRIGIASRHSDPRLVTSECEQMWAADVPSFLIAARSRRITEPSAERREVALIPQSPLDETLATIAALSPGDLADQVRLIRTAFYAKLADPHPMTDYDRLAPARRSDAGELRDLGHRVGAHLVAGMVADRFDHLPRTWIGPVASADAARPSPPGVLGYDLYTGRTGAALALAALGTALEDDGLIEASLSVFQPSVDIIAHGSYDLRSVAESGAGAYSGFAGTLWSITAAGRILGRPEYLAVARAGLRLVRPAAPQPTPDWCDVITGAAGTAVVGLALAEGAGAAGATAVCRAALEADLVRRLPSSGLAHGVAGLLWLAARTHRHGADPAAAALAEQADRELRTAFATGAGGISTSRETEQLSDSWCNGIAGQLVATASAVDAGLVDPERLRELVARIPHGQVATALTLCHGTLGLHEVARMLPTWAGAAPLVDVLTGYLGADRLRGGLEEAHSRQALGPSLMVGQGGLAWHLATRLRPDLPSPLTLTGIGVSA